MIEIVLWLAFGWLCCGCAALWIADSRAWATGRRFNWSVESFVLMTLIVLFGPIGLYGILRKGSHWSKSRG